MCVRVWLQLVLCTASVLSACACFVVCVRVDGVSVMTVVRQWFV